MSIPPVTLSANRPEDLPLLVTSLVSAYGKLGEKAKFAAITNIAIFADRARVITQLSKYSNLTDELQKKVNDIFSETEDYKALNNEQKGVRALVSIPSPILRRTDLPDDQYRQLISKNLDKISFPLVKHLTDHDMLFDPSIKKEVITVLMDNVKTVLGEWFPNLPKTESKVQK